MDQSTESAVAGEPADLASTRASRWGGVVAAVAMVAVFFLSAIYAYYMLHTRFSEYDDEGIMMVWVSLFLKGNPLYDEVSTLYGPFYYLFELVVHSLLGVPLTNDGTRTVSLVVWLTTALAVG